ncbi:MAG TPA: MBL fold metallo-hydrolase [Thermoanaerobaculia bacterium]|nr:MBL fold metallo-hydrolase [Thermoanaerobaculia bacterium]
MRDESPGSAAKVDTARPSGWLVGSVSITPVIEIDAPVPPSFILRDATLENMAGDLDWLQPTFVGPQGELKLIIQAFLIEVRGRKIIVDTCVGNDKQRALPAWNELRTPFLAKLRDAGFPPEQVDLVVSTHLHVDHVGWNTMKVEGQWVPTFPNARYVMAREDFEFWRRTSDEEAARVFGDSVAPVFEHGLVELVGCDHQITPDLSFVPTPGHTPGHCSVAIRSGAAEAVITGDLMHHPSQCAHPEWPCRADVDKDLARATRRAFLERYSDSGILVIGTHWGGPTAVHITRRGAAWRVVW